MGDETTRTLSDEEIRTFRSEDESVRAAADPDQDDADTDDVDPGDADDADTVDPDVGPADTAS